METKYVKFNDQFYELVDATVLYEGHECFLGYNVKGSNQHTVIPIDMCEPITKEEIQKEFHDASIALASKDPEFIINYFMTILFTDERSIYSVIEEIEDTSGLRNILPFLKD